MIFKLVIIYSNFYFDRQNINNNKSFTAPTRGWRIIDVVSCHVYALPLSSSWLFTSTISHLFLRCFIQYGNVNRNLKSNDKNNLAAPNERDWKHIQMMLRVKCVYTWTGYITVFESELTAFKRRWKTYLEVKDRHLAIMINVCALLFFSVFGLIVSSIYCTSHISFAPNSSDVI